MRRTIAAAATAGVLAGLGVTGVGIGLVHGATSTGAHPMAGTSMMATSRGMHASASEASWLREMVAHHRDAITAARELERSQRPAMRRLGLRIVADQSAQVQLMELWLAQWYPDEADDEATYRPMMRDLSGLSGDALDRTFLEDMVPHHMAAVMMAHHLMVRGGAQHDAVADLAATIARDQTREIRWMRARLAEWFGA